MSSNVAVRFLMSLMQQLIETSDFLSSSAVVGTSYKGLMISIGRPYDTSPAVPVFLIQ